MQEAIVLDTNKIFSALLKPSPIRKILLDNKYRFVAPNFISVEIFKHYPKILKFSIHTPEEIVHLYESITENVEFFIPGKISLSNRQKAYELTYDIDLKDMVYVALTLEVDGKLWTGDKELKQGLLRKGFDQFFNPE